MAPLLNSLNNLVRHCARDPACAGMEVARCGRREVSDGRGDCGDERPCDWMDPCWQAAITAHLGEQDLAVELLAEALSGGRPFELDLHGKLLCETLWSYPRFEELTRPKRRSPGAVGC